MDDPCRQLLESLCSHGLITAEVAQSLEFSRRAGQVGDMLDDLTKLLAAKSGLTSFQVRAIRENRIDELVLGNYLLLAPIGRGGMGEVFRARHRRMDRVVALKILPRNICRAQGLLQRFQREVKAAGRLSHPNIVAAYDADEVRGLHFLVMEYVDGRDLAVLVSRSGPLTVPESVECVMQVAAGLGYAHERGIVHRDLKPSNVLIDRQGCAKILDLGLARIEDLLSADASRGASLTTSGQILGTIDYMAPEQAVDSREVDRRADIYSLACTLFFLLTGRPVYSRGSLMERLLAHRQDPVPSLCDARSDVPDCLDEIFQHMMAKQPAQRLESAQALVAALEKAGLAPANAAGQLKTRVFESAEHGDVSEIASASSADDLLPPVVEPVQLPTSLVSRPCRLPTAVVVSALVVAVFLLVLAGTLLGPRDRPGDAAPGSVSDSAASTVSTDGRRDTASASKDDSVDARESELDRRVALRVLQWGGNLEIYTDGEKRPVSSPGDLPEEPFQIAQIGLGDTPVGDSELQALQGLTRLEELALWNTTVSDAGLEHLKEMNSLRALYLSGTAVRGPGLERFTGLKWLELNDTLIDDSGLRYVAMLTRLECLYLNGTRISDTGLAGLHSLVNLKELHLEQTQATPQGAAGLQKALPGCVVRFTSSNE